MPVQMIPMAETNTEAPDFRVASECSAEFPETKGQMNRARPTLW